MPNPLDQLGKQVGPNLNVPQTGVAPVIQQNQLDLTNLNAAIAEMKLNPQEIALYNRHLTNLYGPGGVTNPDGSRSTLFQTTFEINGKSYVIPTVWNGQILPPRQALEQAKAFGLNKFPSYPSDQEAEARYQQLHQYMEKDTANYFKKRQ